MILGFEFFHPLNGNYPDTFPEYGADIVVRARDLIKNRSEEEIYSIIKLVNWLIEKSPVQEESENRLLEMAEYLDAEIDQLPNVSNIEDMNLPKRDIYTSTYAVKAFQAKYEIPPYAEISNLLWSEIFAVLSLSLIDKAIDDELYYKSWAHDDMTDWMYEWRILSHSSYWLIEAMDAIASAEGFRQYELFEINTKKKISLRNTKAAIERHSKTNNSIIAFSEFFNAKTHKSMRNAAQTFCEKFPEKVSHLAPYNQIRTLTEGLSKHLRGIRRSLPNDKITQE